MLSLCVSASLVFILLLIQLFQFVLVVSLTKSSEIKKISRKDKRLGFLPPHKENVSTALQLSL